MLPLSRRPLPIVVVLSLLIAAAAAAQAVSGSLSGTIIDQTRQVVPGATISLINESTGDRRASISNETGVFVFAAVQPGTYTVRVELAGFAPFERRHTVVPANEQLSIGTIELSVGAVNETVTLVASGTPVQTLSAERSALITSNQIELVAERGRDVVSLLRVLPGVAYQTPTDAPGVVAAPGTFNPTPTITTTNTTAPHKTFPNVILASLGCVMNCRRLVETIPATPPRAPLRERRAVPARGR